MYPIQNRLIMPQPTICGKTFRLRKISSIWKRRVSRCSASTPFTRKQRPGTVHVEHGRRERPLVVSRLPSCWLSGQAEWSLRSEINR